MKTKSFVSLVCAMLGLAVLADSYTFTSGTPIVLNDTSVSDYVTSSGSISCNHTYVVDQTKPGASVTLSLNNATAGNYLLTMLGTAGGYTTTYTLTVAQGTTYSKTVNVAQRNTNTNITDTNKDTIDRQVAFLVLDNLPVGEITLTLTINTTTHGTWAGNYGYFTFTKVDSVSDVAIDVSTSPASVTIGEAKTAKPYTTIYSCKFEGTDTNTAIGSTSNGGWIELVLYVPAKATCDFSYLSGTYYASTMTWTLTSADGTQGYSATDAIANISTWTLTDSHNHNFGLLTPGYYVLKGVCAGSATYNGNFGNFTFTYEASSDLDIDANYTLTEDVVNRQVNISGSPVIDLAGHDMTLVQATTALSGTAKITNTSDTLSTLTLKNLTDSTLLTGLQFTGNIQLVIDGWSSNVAFNNNTTIAYDAASANSHTGGTTLQNTDNTKKLTIYNQSALGSGTITFNGNAYLAYPDSNAQSNPTFANNICVHGTGNQFEGAFGGQSSQVNFNGDWSGDGELWMFNSWQPEIYLNNMSGHGNESFTGTLLLTDNRDFNRGYHIGEYSIGFPCATVCLTNRYVSGDFRRMELYLQTRSGIVKFGRLMTDQVKTGDGYTQHTNTAVVANHTTTTAIHIGATGAFGDYDVFSGYFKEQKMDDSDPAKRMALSLVKEGAGTLELNGQTASSFTDGITVSGGTLILNTTVSTATAVTVAEGAQFYGTVPAGGTVTYASGAIIDCDTAHAITGDVDLSNVIVSGSNPSEGVFLTVTGTVSGTKPQLSAELKAVRKLGNRNGKWFIDVATANGVTTYSLVWKPTAFVVVIR